jgi:hypothetical protein
MKIRAGGSGDSHQSGNQQNASSFLHKNSLYCAYAAKSTYESKNTFFHAVIIVYGQLAAINCLITANFLFFNGITVQCNLMITQKNRVILDGQLQTSVRKPDSLIS